MQPNILFAFGDDWGRYASAYAELEGSESISGLVDTPNFDRIAAEGALFQNAYVPAPSCTPCRSSVLSGQYFWQTGLGAILEGAVWDDTIPTFPLELEREGGYYIGYAYKVWSPGRTENAPMGANRTRFEPAGSSFNEFSHWVTANAPTKGVAAAKEALYTEVRENFRAFLRARPESSPFCYWWGPHNTHRTWERGSGYELWGIEPDELKGRLPAFLPDVHEIREDLADYLGECLAFDAGLGILIEELEAIGELDNTLIVVSGDHGVPGFPRAKCNLYDIGSEVALAARWPGNVAPGRVIDDFVNLMDLAPTFVEAGGVEIPPTMTAKSLIPLLESSDNGQIESDRDFVVMGRERHVAGAREGFLPYPQRALRTRDYLYIINFEPDRWPMGHPNGLDDLEADAPDYGVLTDDTDIAYPDFDASPTKAWMVLNRAEPDVADLFVLSFGKRPREELYDLGKDPDCMYNVSDDPRYAQARAASARRLIDVLTTQRDPRIIEQPCRYESGPYTSPPEREGEPT